MGLGPMRSLMGLALSLGVGMMWVMGWGALGVGMVSMRAARGGRRGIGGADSVAAGRRLCPPVSAAAGRGRGAHRRV